MAIDIWPSFQSGIKHLAEVAQPQEDSFLPQRQYSRMTDREFTNTIVADLLDFIMNHDVKEEDLVDYLYDILDLLMMDEELVGGSSNPASIESMATLTIKIIEDLQNGSNDRVVKFQKEVYDNVKQFKGEVVQQGVDSSEGSDD